MVLFKTADVKIANLHNPPKQEKLLDAVLSTQAAKNDAKIRERFVKFAKNLKKVAPRSSDFLYFSAVMIHAAEASLVDDSGEIRKDAMGNPVKAEWIVDPSTGSWKWSCSDPTIRAYRNNNRDIFPEQELKKAYRKWIGRPLCKDHQSSTVDGVRGIIVDAYYDDKFKRVIALCALDKINYPDLARKVSSGYTTDVSMGTAVEKSICFDCGRVASTEVEYCPCMRNRTTYGEINIGLNPIELSIVVTGADPKAKLREVIASLHDYSNEKSDRIQELRAAGCVTPGELDRLEEEVLNIKATLNTLTKTARTRLVPNLEEATRVNTLLQNPNISTEARENLQELLDTLLTYKDEEEKVEVEPTAPSGSAQVMSDTGHGYDGQSHDATQPPWSPLGKSIASEDLTNQINKIYKKLGAMELALRDLSQGAQNVQPNKEENMSKQLRQRAEARRAMFKEGYHLGGGGVNDPANLPYEIDPMAEKVRNEEDKQMVGQGMEPGKDGLHPGYESYGDELELKKKLLRAELEDRKSARHALRKSAVDVQKGENVNIGGTQYLAGKGSDGKPVLLQKSEDGKYVPVSEADIQNAMDLAQAASSCGLDEKKAWYLGGGGVNEPQTYPVDPMAEKVRNEEDKQMVGQGMETGKDGLHPGYESYGDELELKKKLLRAKFIVSYKTAGEIDKEKSKWQIFAGSDKILEANGQEVYEDELEENWDTFASKTWGKEVIKAIRQEGLDKVAWYLKGDGFTKSAQPPVEGLDPEGEELPVEPAPELPAETDELPEADPVRSALDSANEHLEEVEKALVDLEKACEERLGEKSDASELDTSGLVEASDIRASLDENADELAMLAESLDSRLKSGKTAEDTITLELVKLTGEAVEASQELCAKVASLTKTAAKKKVKKEKEEPKKGKKVKKDEEVEEEEKKGKKSKAELVVEELLQARASKRREIAKKAQDMYADEMEYDEVDLEKMVEELLDKKLEEKFAPVGGLEDFIEEEKEEEEHQEEKLDLTEEDLEEEEEEGMDELEKELGQMLDDFGVDEKYASRRAWRDKLAAELGSKYQLTLEPAVDVDTNMPLGQSKKLNLTQDDGDEVEGIVEQHRKIMQKFENLPQVREAMNHLFDMMKQSKIAKADLNDENKLKALAIDPEAAKYLKEYFGEGDSDSAEYGKELTQEYVQKKAQATLDNEKLKMRRAYSVALDMQEKGLIASDESALHAQVDEIMNFDDKSFESFKRALARVSSPRKSAAPALNVGISNYDEAPVVKSASLKDELEKLFE